MLLIRNGLGKPSLLLVDIILLCSAPCCFPCYGFGTYTNLPVNQSGLTVKSLQNIVHEACPVKL